ncbi:hypothetical protein GGR57DRAFT_473602 [Xylariaceae sp. FL1272]|nr:hypothetical protein GGR57DRAFT_473602 [Xylariaceae sp. FL1272]
MMSTGSLDLLQRLPPEVFLPILKQLPDFQSLSRLLRASPYAYHCFEQFGVEIFEALLTSGVCHRYTSNIIRLVAMLRTNALPLEVKDLESLLDLYVYDTQELCYEKEPVRQPLCLSPGTPATVLRAILSSHCTIERRMVSCLNFYLDRFRSLQPLHVAEPEDSREEYEWLGVNSRVASEFVGSWEVNPTTRPAEVCDIGPPTWTEQQRVLRVLWLNELVSQLKSKAAHGSLSSGLPGWITLPHLNDATDMWQFGGWMADPSIGEGDHAHGNSDSTYSTQIFSLENELVKSVLEYAAETRKNTDSSKLSARDERNWPTPRPSEKMGENYEVSLDTSLTAEQFQLLSGHEDEHMMYDWASPLQHVRWEPFRRQGFAIWCDERMARSGFLPVSEHSDKYSRVSDASVAMAWKSVLSEEEVRELHRINKERQDECLENAYYS